MLALISQILNYIEKKLMTCLVGLLNKLQTPHHSACTTYVWYLWANIQ